MANNAIEGLAKLGLLIEREKMTEQEAIDAIACMHRLRKTGLYENWGFNALADNYEKFVSDGASNRGLFPKDKICCGKKLDSEAVATSGICFYKCSECGSSWKVNGNGDVMRYEENA